MPPRHQENDKQHGQRVAIGGVAVKIEIEFAEDRPSMDALQAVEAAGDRARAVGGLLQHQAETERDHDQSEMPKPRDDEAGEIAEHAGGEAGDQQPGQRLAPAPDREQARGIGADAEIGGMAERDDAGKAQDKVERQGEQRRDRDLARQDQIIRRQHERRERGEPESDLAPAPAQLSLQKIMRAGGGDRLARHD